MKVIFGYDDQAAMNSPMGSSHIPYKEEKNLASGTLTPPLRPLTRK